jgi:hypothetical protein
MERVVAAQCDTPRVPLDHVAVAARDHRAQVVIDGLARHPAEPTPARERGPPERLRRQIEAEVRRLRENGSEQINAYTRRSRPAIRGRVGICAQSSCNT